MMCYWFSRINIKMKIIQRAAHSHYRSIRAVSMYVYITLCIVYIPDAVNYIYKFDIYIVYDIAMTGGHACVK